MSTTLTLSDLMISTRQRSDMLPGGYSPSLSSNAYFVSDPELISYINQSAFELYDLLVQKYGDDYFVQTPYSFSTDGVNQFFNLPLDFYKLLGVDLSLTGAQDSFVSLRPFNFSDRNRVSGFGAQRGAHLPSLRYRLTGNQLWLNPLPVSGQSVRLWYVPRLTPLTSLTDTFDGISGWTEYVIVDAAIKCLQKEESDVSVLLSQKKALISRIEASAENRDAGAPSTVVDTLRMNGSFGPFGLGEGEF